MTQVKDERPTRMKDEPQTPYTPGEDAKTRGEIPTGEHRNDDYGKGRQSGVASDKKHEAAQEAELKMNEENR